MTQNPDFYLRISRFYAVFLALMLAGCAAVIFILHLSWWLRALLLLVLAVYGVMIFFQFALLKTRDSVIRLRKHDGKRWQVYTNGRTYESELRGDSTVTAVVSVLRFDIAGRRRPLVSIVFWDSLHADDYRRLTAILRTG